MTTCARLVAMVLVLVSPSVATAQTAPPSFVEFQGPLGDQRLRGTLQLTCGKGVPMGIIMVRSLSPVWERYGWEVHANVDRDDVEILRVLSRIDGVESDITGEDDGTLPTSKAFWETVATAKKVEFRFVILEVMRPDQPFSYPLTSGKLDKPKVYTCTLGPAQKDVIRKVLAWNGTPLKVEKGGAE